MPRLRLSFLIEIIAGLALGFAGARYAQQQTNMNWSPKVPLYTLLTTVMPYYVTPFVCSLSLCGFAALVAERLARTAPEHYGVGRWTWALSGGFMMMLTAYRLWEAYEGRALERSSQLGPWLADWLLTGTKGTVTCTILTGWLGCTLARAGAGGHADGREWTGRVFGVLVVGWTVLQHVLRYSRMRGWI